jgi:hypothetical protein
MTEDLPGIIIALVLIFFAIRYFYPASEFSDLGIPSVTGNLTVRRLSGSTTAIQVSTDGTPSSGPLRGITASQVGSHKYTGSAVNVLFSDG